MIISNKTRAGNYKNVEIYRLIQSLLDIPQGNHTQSGVKGSLIDLYSAVGSILNSIIFGQIVDKIGRRATVHITNIISMVFRYSSLYTNLYYVLAVLDFSIKIYEKEMSFCHKLRFVKPKVSATG